MSNTTGSVQILAEENMKLQNEISKIQQRLMSLQTTPVCAESDRPVDGNLTAPDIDTDILKMKCKQLRSQINNISTNDFLLLPDDSVLRYAVLKDDYQRRTVQLKECATFLQVQRKEINEEIERETKLQGELKTVVGAAEAKLSETDQQKHPETEVYKQLQTKCSKVDKITLERRKQMRVFLDKNFPLPNQEGFLKVKKKIDTGELPHLTTLADLLSLKEIVQELMNACVETPNDAYIKTDSRYWPPYIELLLQCDIALRHPMDASRIKLMPFHL